MQIKDQVVLISGGGSGMGAASAKFFANLGAKVAVLDRAQAAASAVAESVGGLALCADVTDENSLLAALDQTEKTFGVPQVLINCAGVAPAKRVVGKTGPMPLADFQATININLIGTFNLIRLTAARMQSLSANAEGERGVIINTASVAAYEGQIGQAAYSASKGGVVAMTLPIARELGAYGIRVVTIAPGLIATPMLLGMPENVQQSLSQQVPFPKRFGQPEEFAKLASHVVDNVMLNGCVIRLDGAIRMAEK